MSRFINQYREIYEKAIKACEKYPYYDDIIVRIKDIETGREFNELLELNGNKMQWIWMNDWWTPGDKVEFVGAAPIDEMRLP